jgi:hypothetical protein
MRAFYATALLLSCCPGLTWAETPAEVLKSAADSGKYAYVVFTRSADAGTQAMTAAVTTHCEQHADKATWVQVSVTDPAAQDLVKRFDATRLPLPTVFGLAPNGAVSGRYSLKVTDEQLASTVLTPKYADMVKALQEQKIVAVSLTEKPDTAVPTGVAQFLHDNAFEGKVHYVSASADDPAEAQFLKRMLVKSEQLPAVLVFAPPGVHVGTFPATVTGTTISATVHKSGKCNCEKCQQNRK